MKKFVLSLLIALMAIVVANAQQISVVSEGTTSLYRTLQEAIENAPDGSVIYLPGGQFAISDAVKITKKLTIIGIGHYLSTESSEDGFTKIEGNLWFNENSSGSSVMACYITGDVNIGDDNASVNNIVIKFCNLNSVQVKNESIRGTYVNQNYVRSYCDFSNSSCSIYNNVIHSIRNVREGYIYYNIICNSRGGRDNDLSLCDIESSVIFYNILKGRGLSGNYYGFWDPFRGNDCATWQNLVVGDYHGKTFGDNPIIIDAQGSECFVSVGNGYSWWNISSNSDYHFKEEYKQYESQIGIYAGSGFSDKQLAPVPFIVDHRVDSETDASGKLNIHIRVKASE
jgi:hypothetical protein